MLDDGGGGEKEEQVKQMGTMAKPLLYLPFCLLVDGTE